MLKRRMFMLFAVMSFVLLFGCTQSNPSVKSTDNRHMLTPNGDADRTQLIKQSEAIANDIAKLQGVESSYVMLSNQNAYVAVSLDMNEQQRNGMGTNRANDVRNKTMNGAGNVTKNGIESNRVNDIGTNTTYGLNNNATNGMGNNTPNSFGDNATNGVGNNATNGIGSNATDGVVNNGTNAIGNNGRNGIGNNATNGIGNNATNGVGSGMMDRTADNEFLSTQMRSQIEAIVKKKDSTIKNVHISSSPDFVVRMNGYMSDLNSGRAVNEVMNDFNQFVRNMFPVHESK